MFQKSELYRNWNLRFWSRFRYRRPDGRSHDEIQGRRQDADDRHVSRVEAFGVAKSEEDALQDAIIQLAQRFGWKVHHSRKARVARKDGSVRWETSIQGDKGYVDITIARNGTVIHAELKSSTGRLSAEQKEWAAAIGRTHRLWRPKDWPEIAALLSDGQVKAGPFRWVPTNAQLAKQRKKRP